MYVYLQYHACLCGSLFVGNLINVALYIIVTYDSGTRNRIRYNINKSVYLYTHHICNILSRRMPFLARRYIHTYIHPSKMSSEIFKTGKDRAVEEKRREEKRREEKRNESPDANAKPRGRSRYIYTQTHTHRRREGLEKMI